METFASDFGDFYYLMLYYSFKLVGNARKELSRPIFRPSLQYVIFLDRMNITKNCQWFNVLSPPPHAVWCPVRLKIFLNHMTFGDQVVWNGCFTARCPCWHLLTLLIWLLIACCCCCCCCRWGHRNWVGGRRACVLERSWSNWNGPESDQDC